MPHQGELDFITPRYLRFDLSGNNSPFFLTKSKYQTNNTTHTECQKSNPYQIIFIEDFLLSIEGTFYYFVAQAGIYL